MERLLTPDVEKWGAWVLYSTMGLILADISKYDQTFLFGWDEVWTEQSTE